MDYTWYIEGKVISPVEQTFESTSMGHGILPLPGEQVKSLQDKAIGKLESWAFLKWYGKNWMVHNGTSYKQFSKKNIYNLWISWLGGYPILGNLRSFNIVISCYFICSDLRSEACSPCASVVRPWSPGLGDGCDGCFLMRFEQQTQSDFMGLSHLKEVGLMRPGSQGTLTKFN